MELQKSMAQLTEKVSGLSEASRDHGTRLGLLRDDMHGAKVAMRVLLAVFGVIGAGLLFFLNKTWDAIALYIQTHPR